jgi:hypothetical protein
VEADKETKLLFDFDADKLVHVTGSPKEPKIMVTPVVKMIVSKPQAAQSGVKITTPSLPNGAVGTAYTATLTASGGTPPYAWTILTGNLPTELTLDSTGDIAGTLAQLPHFEVATIFFKVLPRSKCQWLGQAPNVTAGQKAL